MSSLSRPYLWSEPAAHAKLEDIVWPRGPVCPHCGAADRIGRVTGKGARIGLKFCGYCRKQFRATLGTVFAGSHVPLHKWFQACFLLAVSNHKISAHRLHLRLEVTSRTAASMLRRLECAAGGTVRGGFGAGPASADSRWSESMGRVRPRQRGNLTPRHSDVGLVVVGADVSDREKMPWTYSSVSSVISSDAGIPPAPTWQFFGLVETAQGFDYPDDARGFDAVLTRISRLGWPRSRAAEDSGGVARARRD